MSCSTPGCGCGCDPCSNPAPVGSSYETLSSALDNFILNFYGTVTKTVVDGVVVWTLPCDLASGIPGYPRDPALGTACYFKELFEIFDARITDAANSIAAALNIANAAQITAEQALAQLALLGTMSLQDADAVAITGGTIVGAGITGLAIPVNPSDAVSKEYADAIAGGIVPHPAVRAVTKTNINLGVLSSPSSVDGVTLVSGDRVLLIGQTDTAENGVYLFVSVLDAFQRDPHEDTAAELGLGVYFFVSEGAQYAGTSWIIITAPVILDTDPIVFSQYSVASTYSAGSGLLLIGTQFSLDTSIAMRRSQNLADVANVSAARGNLGVSATGADTTYAFRANNLSDLPSAATARANLGVTATGLDGNYLLKTSNLGDVANAGTARTNLGVTATGADTNYAYRSNNLSDLPSAATARANLGLSSMAIQSAAAVAITGGSFTGATNIAPSTAATGRTIKGNFNIQINVKDYGAVGNGATDDTAAINSAIAATPSYGTLYFPAGRYRITSGLNAFASVLHVTIRGEGAASVIFSDAGASGANVFVINNTCSYFDIFDLHFIGNATVRASGIHIRLAANYSTIHDCLFYGCSDFGVLVSNDNNGYIFGCRVYNCISQSTLGDGFHFGGAVDCSITDCQAISTGDDGLGIGGDYAAYPSNRIEVANFSSYQPGNFSGGGTHGGGIRIFDGCVDIHVVGGQCYQPCEAGFIVCRAASTTAFNSRIVVEGFKVMYGQQVAGMLGSFDISFGNQIELHGCRAEGSANGSGFSFHDIDDLVVSGCTAKSNAVRQFVANDFTTANTRATWTNWVISGCVSLGGPSNEIFYFTPAAGITITDLMVLNCSENGCLVANYIFTNRLAGVAKIMNNVSLHGAAIANGGSGVAPTLANNN